MVGARERVDSLFCLRLTSSHLSTDSPGSSQLKVTRVRRPALCFRFSKVPPPPLTPPVELEEGLGALGQDSLQYVTYLHVTAI